MRRFSPVEGFRAMMLTTETKIFTFTLHEVSTDRLCACACCSAQVNVLFAVAE